MEYSEAEQACEQRGGILASFMGQEEVNFMTYM